ncbi:DoxX family protein [Sorangium sp. So ce1151]|uniref:DoxX family protein n=1 Tax=Sorangium sp. So ce1151 TaxID=3133332 RepID=UPI003F5D9D77
MQSMTSTASVTLAAPTSRRWRPANIALWALQILLSAAFVFGGVNKLLGLQQEMVDSFARIGLGVWFQYFVGGLELVGGIGLLIPRVCSRAALLLAGVMGGAVLTHLLVLPPWYLASIPAVLFVVFGLVAWARRGRRAA